MNQIITIPMSAFRDVPPAYADRNLLVIVVCPGPLCVSGEVYSYEAGEILRVDVIDNMLLEQKAELFLSRNQSDELARLAGPCTKVYLIRVPESGPGSAHLEIGENTVPVLVQPSQSKEDCLVIQKQKHVS